MKGSDFHTEARRECREDILRYTQDDQRPGADFTRCVFQRVDQIEQDPSTGFTSEHETRTLLVKRFPHSFAFKDSLRKSWIIAVAHTARRPGDWRRRVEVLSQEQR